MQDSIPKRGRKSAVQRFDDLYATCPPEMRRPKYLERVGVRRGAKGDHIFVKVQLPHGGTHKGAYYSPGTAIEIKLGKKASYKWEEVLSKRDLLQARADKGVPLDDVQQHTFTTWADDWFARRASAIKRADTIKFHLTKYLKPEFGRMALEGITPVTIERWLAEMRGKGLSDSYLKRMMATLKAILNDAIRAGALTDNAATKVSKLRDQARQRVLSDDEITLLLDTAKTEEVWMYNAILWALHSGMRRGEILALTWNNVHQMSDGVEFVTLENTKSGRPRNVTCTEQMSVVLSAQRKVAVKGDNRVWPVSEMTFRRRWEDIRKKAGLSESIVFHDLRRTNATVAASQGVDVRTLADRMGHTDLKMMGKHYAHRVDSAERRAATQINEAFKTMGKPSAKRESPLSKQLGEAHIS